MDRPRAIKPPRAPLHTPHHPHSLSPSPISSRHRQEGVHAAATVAVEVGHGRDATPSHSLISGPYSLPYGHRPHPSPFSLFLVHRRVPGASPELLPCPWKCSHLAVAATRRPSKYNSRHDLPRASAVDSRHRRRLPCPLGEVSVHRTVAGATAPPDLGRRRWTRSRAVGSKSNGSVPLRLVEPLASGPHPSAFY